MAKKTWTGGANKTWTAPALSDVAYQVNKFGISAAFEIRGGKVTQCATVLVRKLAYWMNHATRIGPEQDQKKQAALPTKRAARAPSTLATNQGTGRGPQTSVGSRAVKTAAVNAHDIQGRASLGHPMPDVSRVRSTKSRQPCVIAVKEAFDNMGGATSCSSWLRARSRSALRSPTSVRG